MVDADEERLERLLGNSGKQDCCEKRCGKQEAKYKQARRKHDHV